MSYETDYSTDGYDASFEIGRYESIPAHGSLPLVEVSESEEVITIKQPRRVSRSKSVPYNPPMTEFFCGFVTSVKTKCRNIKRMINYQHMKISKTDDPPYPDQKTLACTRLELESEMRRRSPEEHDLFLAKVMESRVCWLVLNHLVANRSFSEANITSLIYEAYVGKYVCVNEGRSTSVWMFDDTRWTEISPAEVWQGLSTTFIDFLRECSKQRDEDWEMLCDDVVRYLSAVTSRERIQRDLLYRLTNNAFQSKLDSKPHLIGMTNGVYDLSKNMIRDAVPMDYVSMSTGIDYLEKDDKKLRAELDEILRTVFPDKSVRKFFIQSCASLLEGRNKEKYVYVWWGKGNNAKSMMERLLASALGDYSTVAATSLVTSRRGGAENASPQLSALEGKLAVFLQEPNPDETIRIGMIKELSGNDAITARALFKGNRTFIPKFKLIIVCNSAIEIPNIDLAFMNRLIVIPFESTFRTKEDYKRRKKKGTLTKYDHLLDSSIARKIHTYAEVFFRMLVDQFQETGEEPLHIPRKVRRATDDYVKENNFSFRFIMECCTEEEEAEIGIKALHSEMKTWMNQHHGAKKVPNIDIFRDEVVNCGYDIDVKGVVHGLAVDMD